jgi:hypothetical protein
MVTMKRAWLAVALCSTIPVFAQEDGDAPEKGVARLSLMNGEVKVRQGETGDETAGALNAPLLSGDRVYTSGGARAELQFDHANMIRMGSLSEVRLSSLADRRYEVQVASGLVMVRVTEDAQAQFEVDTPTVSVRPSRRGSYRILVQPDGSSEITVRSGEAGGPHHGHTRNRRGPGIPNRERSRVRRFRQLE